MNLLILLVLYRWPLDEVVVTGIAQIGAKICSKGESTDAPTVEDILLVEDGVVPFDQAGMLQH